MTAIADIKHKHQVRARLSLVIALDELDAAQARIRLLTALIGQGAFSDNTYRAAVANVERAISELAWAERETRSFPEHGEDA